MGSENTFPSFVESLLRLDKYDGNTDEGQAPEGHTVDPLANLSSINTCLDKDSLRQLDRKLVRFDCSICDMFEEEFYVPLIPKKESADSNTVPLVYKYFTELTEEQVNEYQTAFDPSKQPIERGNVLASSLVHMQGWAGPQAAPSTLGVSQKVLLKLYDKDIQALKLNDMVTCIGVLEYT